MVKSEAWRNQLVEDIWVQAHYQVNKSFSLYKLIRIPHRIGLLGKPINQHSLIREVFTFFLSETKIKAIIEPITSTGHQP